MITRPSPRNVRRIRTGGFVLGVGLVHAALFAMLNIPGTPLPFVPPQPAIELELVNPPPPPEPPAPPQPPSTTPAGGGAPAAPSRINIPPEPPRVPPELQAPPVQAPEPALVIGVSPIASPTPGMGQGGEGTGTGTGRGAGSGPGSGGGSGPQLLRGPTQGQILDVVPPAARRARRSGRGVINCLIRPDQRLEACRVVSEAPPGFGFGEAALRASVHFRYRPPLDASGRVIEDQRVTVFVQFGRPGSEGF